MRALYRYIFAGCQLTSRQNDRVECEFVTRNYFIRNERSDLSSKKNHLCGESRRGKISRDVEIEIVAIKRVAARSENEKCNNYVVI